MFNNRITNIVAPCLSQFTVIIKPSGMANEFNAAVGLRGRSTHPCVSVTIEQCVPTVAPRSPCAPRCIVKGSARDAITNK